MERWEYTSFKVETKGFQGGILDVEDLNAELNELGEQGCELVSCVATNRAQGATREVTAILKRRK